MKGTFKVLIVDDTSDDMARPYLMTTQLGCDVTLAFDGEQALTDIRQTNFDLVILDWNLPVRHGRDVLKSLRTANPNRDVNIVIYSGEDVNVDELDIENSGYHIVDQWEKPIGPVEMLKRMKMIRERMRR